MLAPGPGRGARGQGGRFARANGETEPVEIEVFITSPADGATINGPHTGANVTVQGTVWTNRALGGVSVRIGTGTFQAATLSGGNWTFPSPSRHPGWTTITARARTSTGIISDTDDLRERRLAPPPDTAPPAVGITSPPTGLP